MAGAGDHDHQPRGGAQRYPRQLRIRESDQISIDAPEVAENGETVPVTVESSLPNVESITLYVPENNAPISAVFELGERSRPRISQRIQMADTSEVVAIAKSEGKLYGASQKVRVTVGGCGG
ncbi:MAG: thiosulfate oxidation carrier protein SoxY [Halorhodospira sp.]